jgi:dihydrofolate reductase
MRRVVLSLFMTLDGVIEAPHEWSGPYWNDDIARLKLNELFASDALLLGRVTYEGFAAAWPTMTDGAGFAERMNKLPKFVATRTRQELTWNANVIKGSVPDEVAKLKQQPGMDILIGGSADLSQTLMKHDLIDEYRLLVYPVVLGKGKRLFVDGNVNRLKLIESRSYGSGVVLARYEPYRET